jgi:hypothetical protein
MTSMVGPLGALPVGPAAATIEVGEDVDGGPPRGCYQCVRQPSMAAPLGALLVCQTAFTTEVKKDVDGAP